MEHGVLTSTLTGGFNTRYIEDAVKHIVESDIHEISDTTKGYADGLFQDLIALYHISAERYVERLLPTIERVADKFRSSYLTTCSADAAYYLGLFESLQSLYKIGEQQLIMNRHAANRETLNFLKLIVTVGSCVFSDFLEKSGENTVEELYDSDIIYR